MVNINIEAIRNELFNANRFDEVITLVLDYAMPGMTGLEVFKKLNKLSVRKILLTGEAGLDLALEAFNEGIIYKFILKNTPDYA